MRTAVRLVVRNSCKDFCGYVTGFFFCVFLYGFVPLSIEGVHMTRSTRTAASDDGDVLSALDSWYDGPQSWTPGSDEFLRNHEGMYYALTFFDYAIFITMNVIAWVRYFTLRNWTYGARFFTFIMIELFVNMALVWRPTPDGAIQLEPDIVYYTAAPIVTYADCFISARLAWYWTIIVDWWRYGGFICCCASRDAIENPNVTKTYARYFVAFLLLGQSIVYPVITRQMYTDALVCNAFMAYAVYSFIERVWAISNDPKQAAEFESNSHTERRALIALERMDSTGTFSLDGEEEEEEEDCNTLRPAQTITMHNTEE